MPNKYYIDQKQNIRLVPSDKEGVFKKKFPGSREATQKELSDFESSIANQNAQKKEQADTQIVNPNQFAIPDYTSPELPEPRIQPFAQPSKEGAFSDAMKSARESQSRQSDQVVRSAIDEFQSYGQWIDEVNKDTTLPEKVKQELNDWYSRNFRDTNEAVTGVRTPSLVGDYLDKNKQTVDKGYYIPGSPMFGGMSYVEGTAQENTPEQLAMIGDFLINSPKGRLIVEDENNYLQQLDNSIDALEAKIKESGQKRTELTPRIDSMMDYLRLSKPQKQSLEAKNKKLRAYVEERYPFEDIINAENQLNELKKLRDAYRDGDKNAIKQFTKEFGRRIPYDLTNAATLGLLGMTEQGALTDALRDPNNRLTREAYDLIGEYQQAHQIDRTIAQDIAQGTTGTLPFIAQFTATGGVTGAAGKALLGAGSKLGLTSGRIANIGGRLGKVGRAAGTLATDVLDAGARSLIMPTTYADAMARTAENPGSFLDNFAHSWFVNTIENYSEKFGAHLPGMKVTNPKIKKAMELTGVQGFPEEFAEEQVGTILNAMFDTGEGEWSDLIDPRNQLVTAGTIGLIQVPYLSIRAGGYSAAKFRNVQQKRSINKGYKENIRNMEQQFGEDAEAMTAYIDESLSSVADDAQLESSINGFMLNVMQDKELSDTQKDAVLKYTMSSLAKSSLETGKSEQIQQVQEETAQVVQDNVNPKMDALVSVKLAGYDNPMQVVSGNIIQLEDGSVDRKNSDQKIYYLDQDNNKKLISIDFVEGVVANVPTAEATAQAVQMQTQEVVAQQENDEVREYNAGEVIRFSMDGTTPLIGEVTGTNEDGTYTIVEATTGQPMSIQPRMIINDDHMKGVENGSNVNYINEAGQEAQGVVATTPDLFAQGMIALESGDVVPIENIRGLVEETDVTESPVTDKTLSESQEIPEVLEENEQSVTTSPSEQNTLSLDEIPKDEKGNILFTQIPVENTISALGEVYEVADIPAVIDATIANIQKQVDKAKSPKPTGDITKDIANKRQANQQLEELNSRLAYWNEVQKAVQDSKPLKEQVAEQLVGEETANEILAMGEPMNGEELAAVMLANGSIPILYDSYKQETGGGNTEASKLFGLFKSKENGGVSVERAGELLMLADLEGGTNFFDQNDPNAGRNAIIEVLSSVRTRGDLTNFITKNRERMAEREREAEQAAYAEWCEENFHMTPEEYEAYDEVAMQEIVNKQLTDEQDNEFISNFIDEEANRNENNQGNEQRGSVANSEGSGSILQSEESVSPGRTGSTIEGPETNDGSVDQSDATVQESPSGRIDKFAYALYNVNELFQKQSEGNSLSKEELSSLSSAIEYLDSEGYEVNNFDNKQLNERENGNIYDVVESKVSPELDEGEIRLLARQPSISFNGEVIQKGEVLLFVGQEDQYREKGKSKKQQPSQKEAIAKAEAETDTNPTEAQKEAGNYKKGKVTIQGFDISIEQPKGSTRSGVNTDGKAWSVTMNNTYGYIRKTEGKDGDHIDVFLGDNPESDQVFVVDQNNQDSSFDEHKVMLGFNTEEEARAAYLSNYEEGWQGLGNLTQVDIETFRKWTESDTRRIKPFAEYKEIQEAPQAAESTSDVRIVDYSEKAIAVYGNTKELKDELKAIGGRFNPKLKEGAGWIFPKSKRSEVDALINGNVSEQEIVPSQSYGSENKLISSEKYEELRKQMRDKLNNLNAGFDPELFTIGTQMAMYHIEAGARKFSDFAARMMNDLGENVRPYLKSFYESARYSPGMETYRNEMDALEAVNSFDVDRIGKETEKKEVSKDSLKTKKEAVPQQLSIFDSENKPISHETDSNQRSDNRASADGRTSTRSVDSDVRERTDRTKGNDRAESQQRTPMEGDNLTQGGQSERSTGNHADTSGAELHTGQSAGNLRDGRKDRGNSERSDSPLNTNNNRQTRDENVVPRGNVAKINANIAAIKLAKRLTESGKKATPEQMNVLRRYTGWGGLSAVFQEKDKNYKVLQSLLTDEEYESARSSTTTAFYTPPEITASVWDMIEKLGFQGGSILEPSAGIGNFFALMPESISNTSQLRGVELDTVSGSILKLLYPDANINISGFEKQRIPNNSMDLVVSNVPFGNFKVYDSNHKDISTQFDIHDYFIAKSIRTLKAGGIGVFITTSSTLDKSTALRNWAINNGNTDFIDAVRLNTDTFKNDAGTEATSDIIIVRKRDASGISPYAKNMQDAVVVRETTYMQQVKDKWGYNAGEVEKTARMTYNKYFNDNPERLSGEMKFGFEGGNAIRPTEQRLAPVKKIDQQEVISKLIDELPSDIYNPTPAEEASQAVANNGTKEGGLTLIDGKAYIVQYNEATPVDWNTNKAAGYPKEEILQDYLDIKNAVDELLEMENSPDNEPVGLQKLRTKLNNTYDSFVKKYGTLNENKKITFLQDDIDFPSVSAIENVEDGPVDKEKIITKSDIFSRRVIDRQAAPKADNVTDAVRVSINQNGKVDIPYIAELLGKTNEEVQKEIVKKRIGFVNPETGLVEDRNQYLSGNVREKLSLAQQANQENEYDSNIEELSKVVPADIPINLIKLTLGSTWLPDKVYNDFFKETFDVTADITRTPSTDKFIAKLSNRSNAKDRQMGMPEAEGSLLALNAMNNTSTTIYQTVWDGNKRKSVKDPIATAQASAKQTELEEIFEAWVKQKKDLHEELENLYNNTFNAVVNPTTDVDSFDRFPGTGGKVVPVQSNLTNKDEKEVIQFRTAKENTEADNESVISLAKKLDMSYDKGTGLFSTEDGQVAANFMKQANGTAKILREHQKAGVIRGLEGATLLAHEVGTGKTLTLISTAMEMRRLGLAKKPTIIVQRSTYKQFVKEIKNQYPNAKVLAPSAKDLTGKQRQQLFAKIAYNDWDIVVLYHSYLDSIPDDPQRVAQYINERIQEKMELLEEMERAKEEGGVNVGRMIGALKKEIRGLENDREKALNPELEDEPKGKATRKRSVKDIEKVRSGAAAKAEQMLDRRTDNTMTFEQLGIDALLVDEAHAYKKLGFVTSLNRVKGIDTAASKRAQSTRLKTSYILENHNGKNVVFATGTPISNTMAEMWTFLRFLLPKSEMSRLQMNNFDAFVNNFGSIEESAEFGTNGKFRIASRFSSYSNVPELIAAWRQVAHTVLTEEVSSLREGVGTPRLEGGKPTDIMIQQTPPLKSVMKAIKNKLEEFENMSGAEKKENSYIPLVMFGFAKRAAIDVRLLDPNLPDHSESKTNITVREILKDLKNTSAYNGAIAVFCDSYQSSDKVFNVFREIKQKLSDNGIPEEQIAIINDYEKDNAKEKLFASVNKGEVRVIMGTTEKLGVGVNIQERLHMAVHMDAPIRPSDYQQRNGRIARQGNTHLDMDKTIEILRIGVQKTLDVTGYQRLEIKKKFIDQIMKGDVSQRMIEEADIESTDSSNFNQMMANLSGSQAALALSVEQNKLKKLQNAKQYHADNQVYMSGAVKRARGVIVGNGQALERFDKYREELKKQVPEGEVTSVAIGKLSAHTPDDIDALLHKHITKKIDKVVSELREDVNRNKAALTTSLSINDIKFDLKVNIERVYTVERKTRIIREIEYTTPNNTISNPYYLGDNYLDSKRGQKKQPLFEGNAGASVTNLIDDINEHLSGYYLDREVQKYKIGIDKAQRDIDAYEPQVDSPFPKEKELKATIQKVEDLTAQMEVELQQIEAEESKEVVEAIDLDSALQKNNEDPEDDPTPPSGGRRRQSSSDNFQPISAEKFNSLVDRLNDTGLAVDVVIDQDFNTNEAIKDAEGNVYGYVTSDGVIHLDASRMNANTPIHEFGHLWNDFTKKNNRKLYDKGVSLIKQSPYYWEKVKNNPAYQNLSEEQMIDEALAMAIGDKGEGFVNRSMKDRFVDWLSDVWNSIKKLFGFSEQVNIEDMTLSDFTDMAVSELLGGKKLTTDTNSSTNEVRFQSVSELGDAVGSNLTEEARIELDMRLNSRVFKLREAWEDRHLAVKEFLDVLRKKGTKIEEYNDYYLRATHLSGMNDAQLEIYRKSFQQPLNKAIKDLEKIGLTYRSIENYAILKHGLERNEWMRQNALNEFMKENPTATQEQIDGFAERLPEDYSGVTAVTEEVGMEPGEFIIKFEEKAGKDLIDNFWKRINNSTNFSLKKNLDGGYMDNAMYKELTERYSYYIPLRGHDDIVAEDRWDYEPYMGTYYVNPLIKAKGRRTRSEKPFAYIAQAAQSAITGANKNTLSHTILRLALKDKTGLMSVNKAWYELKGEQDGQPIWEQVSPEYSENPETYRQNIELFEEKMRLLEESGQAFQSGKRLNIGGLFIKKKQAEQHEVRIFQNGTEYIVYINANPAVAQAINGSNIKETSEFMQHIAKVSRFMAANFTTRNPLFIATNFSRDYLFASSILRVKESVKYALKFQKNIPSAADALQRYIRGKSDLNKENDRYMMEYIMNGAKTGYSHIVEIQRVQKQMEKDIKKGDYRNMAEKVFEAFGAANEFVENLSRLSVYITSRQEGRSVARSVNDAKNVTVNFNQAGAGSTLANFVRPAFLFVNAGIQSLSNIIKAAQKNPRKAAALFSFYTMSGAVMCPMLAFMLGGDDGLEDYYNLGEWERQNNFCIYIGKGFIKVPLPHELRVFHRVGDHILHYLTGKKDLLETVIEIPLSFSDLIPIDPHGAVEASWAELTPDALRPFSQLAANRNFMGSRIYNEWANPNTPGYLQARTNKKGKPFSTDIVYNAAKDLDSFTGGDGVERGLISVNPDIIEHFARGYFGGLYSSIMQTINTTSKIAGFNQMGDVKLSIRDTPLKTFFASKEDLRASNGGINKKYFEIRDEIKETRRKTKGYQDQAQRGDLTIEQFSQQIERLSKQIEKQNQVYPYILQIEKYERALKELDGEELREAERIISELKKQVIEINSIKE